MATLFRGEGGDAGTPTRGPTNRKSRFLPVGIGRDTLFCRRTIFSYGQEIRTGFFS